MKSTSLDIVRNVLTMVLTVVTLICIANSGLNVLYGFDIVNKSENNKLKVGTVSEVPYPEMILTLPDINVQRQGVMAKLLQADQMQVVFFQLEADCEVEPHAHGEQWGIIVDGELELSIGGMLHRLKKGDSYYIPAGVEHWARVIKNAKAIDFFNEQDRYQPQK